jgi:hypothetical protein
VVHLPDKTDWEDMVEACVGGRNNLNVQENKKRIVLDVGNRCEKEQ